MMHFTEALPTLISTLVPYCMFLMHMNDLTHINVMNKRSTTNQNPFTYSKYLYYPRSRKHITFVYKSCDFASQHNLWLCIAWVTSSSCNTSCMHVRIYRCSNIILINMTINFLVRTYIHAVLQMTTQQKIKAYQLIF